MEHAEGEQPGPEREEGPHEDEEELGAGMVASAILIALAAVALAPLTGLVAHRREGEDRAHSADALGRTLPLQLAMLSTGAAVVHFAVIAQHLDEWWLTGIFFIVVAVFQLGWALLVLLRPSPLVYPSGAVINALVVVTWIVSRTSGFRSAQRRVSPSRSASRTRWPPPTRCFSSPSSRRACFGPTVACPGGVPASAGCRVSSPPRSPRVRSPSWPK